jgi:hypothetical protein
MRDWIVRQPVAARLIVVIVVVAGLRIAVLLHWIPPNWALSEDAVQDWIDRVVCGVADLPQGHPRRRAARRRRTGADPGRISASAVPQARRAVAWARRQRGGATLVDLAGRTRQAALTAHDVREEPPLHRGLFCVYGPGQQLTAG